MNRNSSLTRRAGFPFGGSLLCALFFGLALTGAGCGGGEDSSGQLVVIGLDGATWELLQPWIDAGDLPVLGGLQDSCAWGELQSSVPYLSPPAWTTAVTGVNPGKHAVFDFQRRIPGEKIIVNETAKSRRAQPIWNVLSAVGRRSLLLNIPMTDPPDQLEGICIAGFPHQDHTGFTYPPELEEQLGEYELDTMEMRMEEGDEDSLLAVFERGRGMRKRIALDWLENEPFDLFWVVFTGIDRIQHTFWKFLDPESPHYDPEVGQRYRSAIHDFWVEQDRALGQLLAAVSSEATVLVLSDHGFGPLRYDLRVQNLLRQPDSGVSEREANSVYSMDPGDACRLYIARRGRDVGGGWPPEQAREVVRKIAATLRSVRDPRTGQLVCDAVLEKDQVYSGPYAEKGPDLTVVPAFGYFLVEGSREPGDPGPVIVPHPKSLSGWHRMNGIYAIRGAEISPGRKDRDSGAEITLVDLMPTLLYLLGEPIPEGLDGRLLRSWIDPAYLEAHPPQSTGPLEEDYREMTPDELRNLRNLPYIGG
ncbi:MAG: alkaline phosphatase family protein [Candidatus Eisenbacteria sp.]|nr:alkaline phosphatase family protein [Candidatus Eisenbacteria bacterium]